MGYRQEGGRGDPFSQPGDKIELERKDEDEEEDEEV